MKIPKSLEAKRDEQCPNFTIFESGRIGFYSDDNSKVVWKTGYNAAVKDILESEALKEIIDCSKELRDLMAGVRFEGYRPDSLTNQPIDNALNNWDAFIEGDK